jgi:hypothetical protein
VHNILTRLRILGLTIDDISHALNTTIMSSSEPKGLSHLDFMEFCERMTASLTASTEAAAELPEKSDMGFHRTLDRKFAKGIDATGERIMDIANSILKVAAQSPSLDSKADGKKVAYRPLEDEDTVVDHFRSVVTEIVDQLLENADRNLDEANGEHTKERIQVNASLAAQAGKKVRIAKRVCVYIWLTNPASWSPRTHCKGGFAFRSVSRQRYCKATAGVQGCHQQQRGRALDAYSADQTPRYGGLELEAECRGHADVLARVRAYAREARARHPHARPPVLLRDKAPAVPYFDVYFGAGYPAQVV